MMKTKKTLTAITYAIALSCTAPAMSAHAAEDSEPKVESELEVHAKDGNVEVNIKFDPLACVLALALAKKKKTEAAKKKKKHHKKHGKKHNKKHNKKSKS